MSATRPAGPAFAGVLAVLLASAGLAVSAAVVVSSSPAPAVSALPPTPVVVPAQAEETVRDPRRPPRPRASASLPQRRAAARAVRPAGLVVRSVGLSAPVRPVGATTDGLMALPADPRVLGWYRFGPSVARADRGSAVLAGHLDSRRFGLGPLVRLRDVRPGDRVRVVGSDRATRTFVVRRVDRYDRRALPAELFARSGPLRLRIITCGGAYDTDRGGYQQNLVVTATPL